MLHHMLILFSLNSRLYNQTDGVPMGSPLTSVVSNIFMGIHESMWLNEYDLNKSKFYSGFVDDILAACGNQQDSLIF